MSTPSADIIFRYFPDLNSEQREKINTLYSLYSEWNGKINVISRKDIGNLYVSHVLHSMAIGKIVAFNAGASVLDVGTGGGFPGIPLAILFPATRFHLIDSIGKKITVVRDVAEKLSLSNVTATQIRAEQVKGEYDFIVSRAVTRLKEFYGWVSRKVRKQSDHALYNGILYLKGGDLADELAELRKPHRVFDLSEYFKEDFFETKKLVYVPL